MFCTIYQAINCCPDSLTAFPTSSCFPLLCLFVPFSPHVSLVQVTLGNWQVSPGLTRGLGVQVVGSAWDSALGCVNGTKETCDPSTITLSSKASPKSRVWLQQRWGRHVAVHGAGRQAGRGVETPCHARLWSPVGCISESKINASP